MKNNILLLLVATATAALAAALGQGNANNAAAAADPANDRIMPRSTRIIWVTKLTTIARASLRPPTPSSSVVVQTAFVFETIFSDPALDAWTTLGAATELPDPPSTSTSYSTVTMVAHSVTSVTTTLLRPRLPVGMMVGGGAPGAGVVDIPPSSSIITSVGAPLSTSSAAGETLPPPILSPPVSSTITTVCHS